MRVAVIGSRGATDRFLGVVESSLPAGTSEIVSGGAVGIDSLAKKIAKKLRMPLKEFLPDYSLYGHKAPIVRNTAIVDYADYVLAFWDGKSRGTGFVVNYCIRVNKPIKIVMLDLAGGR